MDQLSLYSLYANVQEWYQSAQVVLESWGYIGLFIATFVAATIVPFPSELVFICCVSHDGLSPLYCILIATAGNTLGALTLYWMGTLGKLRWLCTYGRIPPHKVRRFCKKAQKWGPPLALISFLPAFGQVIVISLGLLHCDFKKVTMYILIGKGVRYIVTTLLTLGIIGYCN